LAARITIFVAGAAGLLLVRRRIRCCGASPIEDDGGCPAQPYAPDSDVRSTSDEARRVPPRAPEKAGTTWSASGDLHSMVRRDGRRSRNRSAEVRECRMPAAETIGQAHFLECLSSRCSPLAETF
jgi:hypothetical protein